MTRYKLDGFAWSWWLTFGWTAGYSEYERIFWIGPVGLIFYPVTL